MRAVLPVVVQALEDVTLSPTARLCMWYLSSRLDVVEHRPCKILALAFEMRCRPSTVSAAVRELIARGYVDARKEKSSPRLLRLYASRRVMNG